MKTQSTPTLPVPLGGCKPATAPAMSPLTARVPQWLNVLQARGYKPNTIAGYQRDLQQFMAYAQKWQCHFVQQINARVVDEFIDHLLVERQVKSGTVYRKKTALASFLNWCVRKQIISTNPANGLRLKHEPTEVIAPEWDELKTCLAAIERDPIGLRDLAMLRLLATSAVRVAAIVALSHLPAAKHRIDRDRMLIVFPNKGSHRRHQAPIDAPTLAAIDDWLAVRPHIAKAGEHAMFVGKRGKALSRNHIYKIVRDRGEAVGIERLGPHKFRHRRIGQVMETVGIDAAKTLACHKNRTTTLAVYGAHADPVNLNNIRNHCGLEDLL